MPKKTYTEVLIYIENHLQNIDSHLERLNDSVSKNASKIQKQEETIAGHDLRIAWNKTTLGWVCKIGGYALLIVISLIIGLRLFGIL